MFHTVEKIKNFKNKTWKTIPNHKNNVSFVLTYNVELLAIMSHLNNVL